MELALGEAAARLGISRQRVHQLVGAGTLPARRVAGRWIIEDCDLDRAAANRRPGRHLSPRVVWGLIGLLETGSAPDLSAAERFRVRTRLRSQPPLEDVALLCRGRADVHRLHAHPGSLPRALAWKGAVPTGTSAGARAIVDPRRVEMYLSAAGLEALRRGMRIIDGGEDPNVIVRVPTVDAWPFPEGRAGPVTVALDLWDAGDVRSRRAGDALFRRLLSEGRFETR